jgi:hypothetical protein
MEEQLRLKLRRFIEASIPEMAGRVRVKCFQESVSNQTNRLPALFPPNSRR